MKSLSRDNRDTRIDVLKSICAILVLFLHTANLGKPYANVIEEKLSTVLYFLVWTINPVEFFFIASAFLLFKKFVETMELDYDKKFRVYIRRLVVLYLFWSLFYLDALFASFFEINDVRELILAVVKLFRRLFLIGSSGHMWYILSLIYGLILLKPFLNEQVNDKKKLRIAWGISSLLYVISLFGDSYFYVLPKYCFLANALDLIRSVLGSMYLLRGPLFIMIGYSLAHSKEERSTRVDILVSFLLWIGLAAANNIELITIKSLNLGLQYSITVLKPITSYAMWHFIQKLPIPSLPCSSFLAKASTVMYFAHIFFREFLLNFFTDYFAVMVATFIMCLFMTCVLVRLQRNFKFGWLKNVF